jgi:hypothetical protein
MISVETVNGVYSAMVSEDGSVRQIQCHGDYITEYFPSEIAWRATICTTSIHSIGPLLRIISNGDTMWDEDVDQAYNAANELLTIDEDLLHRSYEQTKALWTAAKTATDIWKNIPQLAMKMHTIQDRCETVLYEYYLETVGFTLDYINANNNGLWMPLATELLAFVQQPCFAHCIDNPAEQMMMRATVRRWMTWSSDDAFLAACRAFLG